MVGLRRMSNREIKSMYYKPVGEEFSDEVTIIAGDKEHHYEKVNFIVNGEIFGTRYGDNPYQRGALYKLKGSNTVFDNIEFLKMGKGGPSRTNLADILRASDILKYFMPHFTGEYVDAFVISKHNIPCGFKRRMNDDETTLDLYGIALNCDLRSAFGNVTTTNVPIDKKTARAILDDVFTEMVFAPDFESGVEDILQQKKNLRYGVIRDLSKLPRFVGDESYGPGDLATFSNGMLFMQEFALSTIKNPQDFIRLYVEKGGEVIAEPNMDLLNDKDLEQLWDSWHLQADVRSNGIILYRDGTSIAISSGQQERVGAINLALQKAREKGHSTKGSYLSTCGFIPNVDNVEQAKKGEIKAIVQPGGSIEDANVINAANESGIGQVFTGSRWFGHY